MTQRLSGALLTVLCAQLLVAQATSAGNLRRVGSEADRVVQRGGTHPTVRPEISAVRRNPPIPPRPPKATNSWEAYLWRRRFWLDETGMVQKGAFLRALAERDRNVAYHAASPAAMSASAEAISVASWVNRGPQNVGGRTRSLLIDPRNPALLLAGSVSGGLWRSTSAGSSWAPVNDLAPSLAVGCLTRDPHHPDVLLLGTGEGVFASDEVGGVGLLKSTDNGSTWTVLPGTEQWGKINRVAVSPSDPSILLAATLYGGLRRSTDGGQTWEGVRWAQVGYQVAFSPVDGLRAIASVLDYDFGTNTWYSSALFSTDGGATWQAAAAPLDRIDGFSTRIELAYAPSAPGVVYANLASDGSLWRSTDGGRTYAQRSATNVTEASWYHNAVWVDPTDPDTVVVGGYDIWRTRDGGVTWDPKLSAGYLLTENPHPDVHLIVSDPGFNGTTNRRVYVCTDGGVFRTDDIYAVTQNGGWKSLNAGYQTTQFYQATGHANGVLLGGTQDNGTLRVLPGSVTANLPSGGDGGAVDIDPRDPHNCYMEYQNLHLERSTDGGVTAIQIGQNLPDTGAGNFVAPFTLDPNNPDRLYAAGRSLWRSDDIRLGSPPQFIEVRPAGSDLVNGVAVAPGHPEVIWVSQNDNKVFRTENGLAATPVWTVVSDKTTSVHPLPDRWASKILIDRDDPATVFVALGGFSAGNLQKTTDAGATWTPITGTGAASLPQAPIHDIAQHPLHRDWLYVGTEVGVFSSTDGGATWAAHNEGPANVVVDSLRFAPGTTTLVAGTHGRGLWTVATTAADFSISATPTTVAVGPGGAGTSTVGTTISGGFNDSIWLSAPGLPTGIAATFNPTTIPAPGTGSSTLTLAAGPATPPGSYSVTITASGGGQVRTVEASLSVTSQQVQPNVTVTVDGRSGPWQYDATLNSPFAYGTGDQLPPQVISTGLHFTPGSTFTVSYVSGTTGAWTGPPVADAGGFASYAVNNHQGSSGHVFASFFMDPSTYPINLNELVGTFAKATGEIVGTPFAAGDGPTTITIPSGATQLQLGVNDDIYSDNSGSLAVFVAENAGGVAPPGAQFVQQAKLVGTGVSPGSGSEGAAVAISADGDTVIVGGMSDNSSAGAAWVFTRSGGVWSQQGSKLVAAGSAGTALVGSAVALSADGNTALVGGRGDNGGTGALWAFTRSNGVWTQQGSKLVASREVGGAKVGSSVALSADGNTALVGGPMDNGGIGAVWAFTRSYGVWTQAGSKLVASDEAGGAGVGGSVALSADASTALVGGPKDNGGVGAAWTFTRSASGWTQAGNKLVAAGEVGGGNVGGSVALSADGTIAVVGGPYDNGGMGAVWVFARSIGAWAQQGSKLVGSAGSQANQGTSVALSADGSTVLVGGFFDNNAAGAAWAFVRLNGLWPQQGSKLVTTDNVGGAALGYSLALSADGNTAVVGGPNDNYDTGAAWAFVRPATASSLQAGFTFAPANPVTGQAVQFSDTSTGPPSSWSWSFGDGASGTAQNPSHTFAGSGTYTVALTISDGSSSNATSHQVVVGAAGGGGAHFVQQAKLVGSGAVNPASQGTAVAISADGNIVLVGGPQNFIAYPGYPGQGAVWAFSRSNGMWAQEGDKSVGSDSSLLALQGISVALSADGSTALVGGNADNNVGAAWVFERSNGSWVQQGSKLVASDSVGFAGVGRSVALAADGNTALVGGPQDNGGIGAIWVFTRANGLWAQQGGKLVAAGAVGGASVGTSVALSADGNTALVGGPNDAGGSGALWVFTRSNGVWTQEGGKLVAADPLGGANLGASVALSADGNTALVGGPNDTAGTGAVWAFTRSNGQWAQQGSKLAAADPLGGRLGTFMGFSVALSGDGNTALAGEHGSDGGFWVFTRTSGAWAQQGSKRVAAGNVGSASQGYSVALSADGGTAAVGGPTDDGNVGAAWVFVRQATASSLQAGFTFAPSSPLTLQTVQFTDISTGSPISWSWSFGDGFNTTTRDPSHSFSISGAFTVTLTVSDGETSNTASQQITVFNTPPGTGPFKLRLYNVDDHFKGYLSNSKVPAVSPALVASADYLGDTGPVDLSPWIAAGVNTLDLQLTNDGGGWTYGYELSDNGTLIASGECGTAGSIGCTDSPATAGSLVFGKTIQFTSLHDGSCPPPSIITQPQSVTIASGQTAGLSVSASGTLPISFQWYQGPSGDTSHPAGGDQSSFTTPPLTATTSYWVRLSSGCGQRDSMTATVHVATAPARHLRRS